jgi:hypothetical protein
VSCGGSKKTEALHTTPSFSLNHPEIPGSTPLHTCRIASRINTEAVSTLGKSGCACEERSKSIMPLINLVAVLIVVGILLWLVNRFIPMAGSIKSILNLVVVIVVVFWLLNVFGLIHSLSRIRVG